MADLPAPLVSPEIDLTGFSSFMLDVDRLFTSELVAIGTPEECWAAHLLMCRAWKQSPPGSLPDDPRVLAAFSGAGKRWPVVAPMALREFVKCSDGRWYHPVLAVEAAKAWKKRQQYEADQVRLKNWRAGKKTGGSKREGSGSETHDETGGETHFNASSQPVSYPERQDRTGQNPPSPPSGDSPPGGQRKRTSGHRRQAGAGQPGAFDGWWEIYPHKVGRDAARKAFDKVISDGRATLDDLLAGVETYKRTKPATREWCNPSTWLNQGRWADRPAEPILVPVPPQHQTYGPANGATHDRPTSGPAATRHGIAAGLAALREGDTH